MGRGTWTRRELVIRGASCVAGLVVGTDTLCGQRDPAIRGFKIGACDWTLGKRFDPAAIEVAARIGLDGVQVDLVDPKSGMGLLKPEVQRTYIEAAKKHGVAIGSFALGALNDIPLKTDPRAEEWVSESIDVCKALGVRGVLLAFFAKGDLQNDAQGVDAVVEKLKRLAPKAEKAGVFLGFESWLSAERHMEILDRVNSPSLRVYYDVGNSHKQGYDIYKEIRLLGRNICEFHAKDYDDLYGKGSINFKEVRRAMDGIGYRGWIHMEGVKLPLGVEESCRYDLRYLREIFPREA